MSGPTNEYGLDELRRSRGLITFAGRVTLLFFGVSGLIGVR